MSETTTRNRRKRATLKDVAELVGVHVSTVSRALDPKTRGLITPSVRERIRRACESLNYRPNRAAYSLRTNRSLTIGVVIPDITNTVFPPIIRGIEDAFADEGYVAIIVNTDGRARSESSVIDTLISRGVDGLIAASVQRNDKAIEAVAAQGIEIVTVNRRVDNPGVSSVVNDDLAGIHDVLTHLAELGHKRIAHIGGPQALSTGRARFAGFEQSLAELGLDPAKCPAIFANAFNEVEGERCTEQILAGDGRPTALLCANDRLAIGAIGALRQHGLSCPGDVSVTGFNDMPFVDRIDPPLTTVKIQQYDVGFRAAEILLARLSGAADAAPSHEVMPVQLVVRDSSAPPRKTRKR